VRKGLLAQHLGVVQFLPGAGQLQRTLAGGGLGQFDGKVGAADGRDASQRQGRLGQPLQAVLDQRVHAGRPRQHAARQAAVGQALLQRFQQEQRVAAGSAQAGQRAADGASRPPAFTDGAFVAAPA
jgi:hypothetical protein